MAFNLQSSREPVWPADLDARALADKLTKHPRRPRNVAQILRSVANRHGTSVSSILAGSQTKSFVAIRREAAQRMREEGLSFPEIGRYLGRHHTSIMNLIGKDKMTNAIDLNAPDYSGEWI